MLAILLQAATSPPVGPTAWQLIVTIGGAGSSMLLLVTLGIVYGKLTTRIDVVELKQRDDDAKNAKNTEVELMFDDISRRLDRIEKHFDREKP